MSQPPKFLRHRRHSLSLSLSLHMMAIPPKVSPPAPSPLQTQQGLYVFRECRLVELGGVAFDWSAVSPDQKLVEIPRHIVAASLDDVARLRSLLGVNGGASILEELPHRVRPGSVHLNLGKEGERDAVFLLHELLDLLLFPRLLVPELVARETHHDEPLGLVLTVQLLQPPVVGVGRASLARQVHDEGNLAVVLPQGRRNAVDVVSGQGIESLGCLLGDDGGDR